MKDEKKEVAEAKKPTINYHALPGGNPFPDNVAVIETHPGFGKGSIDKFQVYIRIPFIKGKNYDAENKFCQDAFGCDFKTYLEGCNISTRPQYKTIFNTDGSLPANGHKMLQELANNYRVGRTSSGTSQKVKVALGSKYTELMEKTGMTESEIEALIMSKAKK